MDDFNISSIADNSGNFTEGWQDNLPSDVKEAIGDSKYFDDQKGVLGVIKSAAGLSKMAGKKTVGKDSSDEELEIFFKENFNVPDKDGDYSFEFKDLNDAQRAVMENEGIMGTFKAIMKESGLPSRLAAKLAQNYMNAVVKENETNSQKMQELVDKQKELHGDKYDDFVKSSETGFDKFLNDDQKKLLSQLKEHPVIREVFHQIQEKIKPGRILPGEPLKGGEEGTGSWCKELGIET